MKGCIPEKYSARGYANKKEANERLELVMEELVHYKLGRNTFITKNRF